MNEFKPGKRTLRNLKGVHPKLVAAVMLAFRYATQDFCILDNGGVRSPAVAKDNAVRGVGVANSLHIIQSDGFGHAVDLVAWENGKPSWKQSLYPEIHEAMFRACDELGVPVQNGADWDNDGITGERGEWDWPHFQLPRSYKLAAAVAAMERRIAERGDICA